MAEQTQYTTQLTIAGQVSPALIKQMRDLGNAAGVQVKQLKQIGIASKEGFSAMTAGAEMAQQLNASP